MSKTITATIPARSRRLSDGTMVTSPARIEVVSQDDDGRWSIAFGGRQEPITEAEAIDVLRKSTDWLKSIRREHFPMHGFHA